MSGRQCHPEQQQRWGRAANGEAPASLPSALSFLHGLRGEPLHGGMNLAGALGPPPVVQGAVSDAIGLSVKCATQRRGPAMDGQHSFLLPLVKLTEELSQQLAVSVCTTVRLCRMSCCMDIRCASK